MPRFNFDHIRYTFTRGKAEGPHVLILAGVHGDEYEPMAAAAKLSGMMPDMLDSGMVSIVPIVNSSAFKNASRTAEDGLDLARTCPGKKDGTVTEVVAAEVSQLIASCDYLIDLHTGGTYYEIDPLCGYMLHRSADVLEKQRQMARAFNLKTVWGTSDKLEGRTLSVARDHNVPAIYTEYGGGGGFKKFVVNEYVQGCLNVLLMLGMTNGAPTATRVEYEVEDSREGSGHLQVMLPAAHDGFFEAEVSLGDFVAEGQPVGTISTPPEPQRFPVIADQSGMVFLLRAVPSVSKGDSLGGILPVVKSKKISVV